MTRLVYTSFGNNVDCGGDFVVDLEAGKVVVRFRGGCWNLDNIALIITKNRITVNDNNEVREVEW